MFPYVGMSRDACPSSVFILIRIFSKCSAPFQYGYSFQQQTKYAKDLSWDRTRTFSLNSFSKTARIGGAAYESLIII
jgi:hypothetical protein